MPDITWGDIAAVASLAALAWGGRLFLHHRRRRCMASTAALALHQCPAELRTETLDALAELAAARGLRLSHDELVSLAATANVDQDDY